MAKRKTLFHPDYVREKIRTSQLINRLEKCAFGEISLTMTQLRAIEILCASPFPTLRPSRSSPSRRVATWSKFHLYSTGMNGSGNMGGHRRAYSNWGGRAGRCCSARSKATPGRIHACSPRARPRTNGRRSIAGPGPKITVRDGARIIEKNMGTGRPQGPCVSVKNGRLAVLGPTD
jgi:hypothetical protein